MTNYSSGEPKIGFIGAGNMAQSLIGGLLAQGISAESIRVSDPFPASIEAAAKLGVQAANSNAELAVDAQVLVLAVKPQVMPKVVSELAESLPDKFSKDAPLIISIAAGVSCQALEKWAGFALPIVRCMPNTPSLLRQGATGLYANSQVDEQQKKLAEDILSAVGVAVWVNSEDELDAVTALSGSGPAYFFLLMELMQKAAVDLGLTPEVATQLCQQTALGASRMAVENDEAVDELRRKVTSPNGTTEAAINSFLDNGMSDVVTKALDAAYQRSKTLAEELEASSN